MPKTYSVIYVLILGLGASIPYLAVAAGVYKWVDKDGKVYYSQTAPREKASSKVKTQAAPSGAESQLPQGESIRGDDGECLTIKCMADEMETDRLKREGEYAKRHAENENAAKKKPQDGSPNSTVSAGEKDQLRKLCLNGSIGPSTRDCDDIDKLRRWYDAESRRNEGIKRELERHPERYR